VGARPSKGAPLKRSCTKPKNPPGIWSFIPSITQVSDLKGKKSGFHLSATARIRSRRCLSSAAVRQGCDKNIPGREPGRQVLAIKSGGVSAVVLDPRQPSWRNEKDCEAWLTRGIFPLPFKVT
jgi:hypothetical protein